MSQNPEMPSAQSSAEQPSTPSAPPRAPRKPRSSSAKASGSLAKAAVKGGAVAAAQRDAGAARRELAVTGAGIGGGIAGGALAGLACGPGAPVCVTVGAFVGGALAAFGVDFFW